MSEGRRSNAVGALEAKDMSIYLRKTPKRCSTCEQDYLYVRRDQEGTVDLECPRCDNMVTMPKGMETIP
jgi:phage FluMu protein Com